MKLKRIVAPVIMLIALLAVESIVVTTDEARAQHPQRTQDGDRRTLVALENSWLAGLHNADTLQRILASDFVHVVPTGDFLTKAQHIRYSTMRSGSTTGKQRFADMSVRIYGEVGIVTGIVVTSDERGADTDRSIFTDVFAYRGGTWRAINAQENRVAK